MNMTRKATIEAISYWIPEKKLTNSSINLKHPDWSIDKISAKTGIIERGLCSPTEFTSDIAVNAALKLFKEFKIEKKEIDFLILCTQSPDYLLPTTACIIQDKLGLSKNIGALDFNLGCSGFVYGLSIAKGLILSGSAKNILFITAEMYTKYINENDKSNLTIFGDAAAATLIRQNGDGFEINEFVFGTDGSGYENLIIRNGGQKNRQLNGIDVYDEDKNFIRNDNNLSMNGREIFNFTAQNIPALISEVLEKHKIKKSDVDLFILHQANKFILDFLRNKLEIEEDKFFVFIKNCGNTVSSTIPIALKEALLEKKINTNKNILIAGFGVGYSWASTIIGKVN
jgi:3-oxoacyl-[acyl-carrier-protein] synthase-3